MRKFHVCATGIGRVSNTLFVIEHESFFEHKCAVTENESGASAKLQSFVGPSGE